ncbi:MAG: phosphatidylinositol mannoside acyltransferase [Candidatus Velamenicoccus archaeovorus]
MTDPPGGREAPDRETPKQRVAYWTYRSGEWLAMTLPEGVGRRTFELLGRVAHRTLHGVRQTVTRNQAEVLGVDPASELAASATREAFHLYARYWYDTFRIRVLPDEEVLRRTEAHGIEHIDRALEAGRGCIAVLPHIGNWDLAGHWLAVRGYPIAAVAEELRPERLFRLFLRHREELGLRIVPLVKGEHVGQRLAGLLADDWVVALVADRDLSGRGVPVEMFGRRRMLPPGPALLSLSTGAPLLVCSVWTTPTGWGIWVGPPLRLERSGVLREDVAELTRRVGAGFERAIAAHPTDWHMFQPAWDEAPQPATAAGDAAGRRG